MKNQQTETSIGTIKSVYGIVEENSAVIVTNNSSGTINYNHSQGEVNVNEGKIKVNQGTVVLNNGGTVNMCNTLSGNTYAQVITNLSEVTFLDSFIQSNGANIPARGGQVTDNYGKVYISQNQPYSYNLVKNNFGEVYLDETAPDSLMGGKTVGNNYGFVYGKGTDLVSIKKKIGKTYYSIDIGKVPMHITVTFSDGVDTINNSGISNSYTKYVYSGNNGITLKLDDGKYAVYGGVQNPDGSWTISDETISDNVEGKANAI